MPWKDKNKQREAIKRHYYANRQSYIGKAKRRKKELRDWLNRAKESSPCADCGKAYPYFVMDFDHLKDKQVNISEILKINSSKEMLEKEISKCELVCANCHRIRTHTRISSDNVL